MTQTKQKLYSPAKGAQFALLFPWDGFEICKKYWFICGAQIALLWSLAVKFISGTSREQSEEAFKRNFCKGWRKLYSQFCAWDSRPTAQRIAGKSLFFNQRLFFISSSHLKVIFTSISNFIWRLTVRLWYFRTFGVRIVPSRQRRRYL